MIFSITNFLPRCQKHVHSPILTLLRNLHQKPIQVSWKKPEIGWMKLNFDGSCKGSRGKSSIGGVFRNHDAQFLLGYAESIGRTTSVVAEIAALTRGLELTLENGWRDVWLEGDAKTLVDIIVERRQVKCVEVQKHVSQIDTIMPELNNCIVTHIYREGNRVADKFAKLGHQLEKPRVWRDVPPGEVLKIMKEDAGGKIFLRRK